MFKLPNNLQIILPMNKLLNFFFLIFILFFSISASEINFFELGKVEFKKNNMEKARLFFEKDIVRNPKNKDSYIYLAKIYKKQKNIDEFEKNLNTALLLDPKNEEALYFLILQKIKDGDFDFADKKVKIFEKVCSNMCQKTKELKKKIKKTTG